MDRLLLQQQLRRAYGSLATEGISETLPASPNIRVPEPYPSVSLKLNTGPASLPWGILKLGAPRPDDSYLISLSLLTQTLGVLQLLVPFLKELPLPDWHAK